MTPAYKLATLLHAYAPDEFSKPIVNPCDKNQFCITGYVYGQDVLMTWNPYADTVEGKAQCWELLERFAEQLFEYRYARQMEMYDKAQGSLRLTKEHQRQSCLLYAAQPMIELTQQSFLDPLIEWLEAQSDKDFNQPHKGHETEYGV